MNSLRWQSLLESGIRAVQARKGHDARTLLSEALALAPRERSVRYWLGNALRLCELPSEAEAVFRELLGEDATDVEASFALAWLLREQGRARDAAEVLWSLVTARPSDLGALLKAAGFLRDGNAHEAAIAVMKLALELKPRDGGLHFRQARLLQSVGEFQAALRHLRQALSLDPALGGAWLGLAELQKFSDRTSPDWMRIVDAAGRSLGAEADMCVAFAHGKGLDDMGEWTSAWRAFRRGNAFAAKAHPWNRTAWAQWLHSELEDRATVPPRPDANDRNPVYIVGMLRSGTTLLEQSLDRHPEIHARGELNFLAHFATGKFPADASPGPSGKLAEELWTHLRLDGPANHRYIDKNPLNFRYIGLLLGLMPEARIIHLRRDGRDSCLSCFFHLFQHRDAGFSNRLEDLVDFYRGYRQLMRRWEERVPGRILHVDYAELVLSTTATLERVIDYLGLDWDESLSSSDSTPRAVRTASAWQARQPVHRKSIGRWKNYYRQAPEFFDALAEIDAEFDRATG